jgi:hypothetical protein
MSRPQTPRPAKLLAGLLFRDADVHRQTLTALEEAFGPLDFLTEPEPFTFTTYYDREMGPDLRRQTVAFLNLVDPATLADVKLATNAMEHRFAAHGKRTVNIDPGLLCEERLILATGKNFTHRVYLRDGIYADLTLIYQKGAYQVLPWTYPDYRTPRLRHFLAALRRKLQVQRSGRLVTRGEGSPPRSQR